MAMQRFNDYLGLYDNRGCIGGKHQEFKYDDTKFSIETVERGDGTPPYKTLKYIGGETDGYKIEIPEGVKTADFMFEGQNLNSAPIIPPSIQDTKEMFNGILTEGAYTNAEWNLEYRGFDANDENIDEMTSLAANAEIKEYDDLIDAASEYYMAARAGHTECDSDEEAKAFLDNSRRMFEVFNKHKSMIRNREPYINAESCRMLLVTPEGAQRIFDDLNYVRSHVYGGAYGASPYAENLYDFEKSVMQGPRDESSLFRTFQKPECGHYTEMYGDIEKKISVDKADYVDFEQHYYNDAPMYVARIYADKSAADSKDGSDVCVDLSNIKCEVNLNRNYLDEKETGSFDDWKKESSTEPYITLHTSKKELYRWLTTFECDHGEVTVKDISEEPSVCGGDDNMKMFYTSSYGGYEHHTSREIAQWGKNNLPGLKDLSLDEIEYSHIYWGTEGPNYKGFYNGDTYILFDDINKLDERYKEDAKTYVKEFQDKAHEKYLKEVAEKNKDRDLGKEYTDAIVENGTKKKGFYIPKKGEETVMITNISPKGISERKGKDGGKYYVVGMSVDKETSESGYAKITCQEDNITANKRYLHFKGDKERNVQVTKDGKIETIKMKISELSAAHDRGLEEKSRDKSAKFDREGAVQSEFGGIESNAGATVTAEPDGSEGN